MPTQNYALRGQQVVVQTSETSAAFAQIEEALMTTRGQRVEGLKTARIEREKRAKREPSLAAPTITTANSKEP